MSADRSIYESGVYLAQNRGWHEEDAPFKAEAVVKMLSRHRLALRSLCDVGCGSGAVLDLVSSRLSIPRAEGFDISPQAIELARHRSRAGLTFTVADPFAQGTKFDLAMALDVFEHVENCFDFLRRMRSLGDTQLYHVPLDLSVQGLVRRQGVTRAWRQLGHLHFFTRDTVLLTLESTGHHVVDWFYTTLNTHQDMTYARRLAAYPRNFGLALAPHFSALLLGGYSMMVLCE